jgi:phenylalanine-4-hydroxylase
MIDRRADQINAQHYERYTDQDHQVWNILYDRQMKILPQRADQAFFDGIKHTGFEAHCVPKFEEVNRRLKDLTGWEVIVVPGLIANDIFFDHLKNKRFPATTWLRKMEELDYLEEPDMFHDVFGHVPILSNQAFCNFLSELSRLALKHIGSEEAIEFVSRLYWYTVEFGLIQTAEGLRIYGAGILSSPGESVYALESDVPKRYPYEVAKIMDMPYIKDRFQEHYFVIESYEALFESIPEIEATLDKMLVKG